MLPCRLLTALPFHLELPSLALHPFIDDALDVPLTLLPPLLILLRPVLVLLLLPV